MIKVLGGVIGLTGLFFGVIFGCTYLYGWVIS
jgi:hypothetical protein